MTLKQPKLSIAIPVHTDLYGLWSTVQSIRLMHGEVMEDTQFVIVNQTQEKAHKEEIKKFSGWVRRGVHSVKYIEDENMVIGSAPAKDRAFQESDGEVIACIDSHIFIWLGGLSKMLEWFKRNPTSKDLMGGVMVYDDLHDACATHLNDVWRGEQWGTWAEARWCKCGMPVEIGVHDNKICFRDPAHPQVVHDRCPRCGLEVPKKEKQNLYRDVLPSLKVHRMLDRSYQPFEVWAHGTGFMACRKEAWPGFTPGMIGYGAEEVIIHERFKRNGGKALCAPWLRWTHRFLKVGKAAFPIRRWDKVRNYVLGFKDLGLSLDPIHEHFVASGLIKEEDWVKIVAGEKETCTTCGGSAKPLIFNPYGFSNGPTAHYANMVIDATINPIPPKGALAAMAAQHLREAREAEKQEQHSIQITPQNPHPVVGEFYAPQSAGTAQAVMTTQGINVKDGPGTALKQILSELGIHPSPQCPCQERADKMDEWGVEGCLENRDLIIAWMREGYQNWGWAARIKAASMAVLSGLAFKISPTDPFPDLVDMAIQRASK